MSSVRFAALLLLAPALQAQSIVSPRHFTNAEANSYNTEGLGDSQVPVRFLQMHDDLSGTPRTISSLALRRDGILANQYVARTVVLDLFVSTAATAVATPSATFDNNHGSNRTQVCTFKQVRLPESSHGTLPRPFEYKIPFDQPFNFDGRGPFCWELRIHVRQSAAQISHDWLSGNDTSPQMAIGSFGVGCKSKDHTSAISMRATANLNWTSGGGQITYTANYAPKNSVDFLMIGTSDTNFFGVPLPLAYAPASAPSGACSVYNNSVLLLPVFADASGFVTTQVGVPATPEFHAGRIFTQMLAFEPGANAAGVITSNMVVSQWVAPYTNPPLAQVVLTGSLGAAGTARARTGYVVMFE